MLLPLFYLSWLLALTGSETSPLPYTYNMMLCPITYYGKKYDALYLSKDTDNINLCFNGYDDDDCITAPLSSGDVTSETSRLLMDLGTEVVRNKIPITGEGMKCHVKISYHSNNREPIIVFLVQYETRTVLGLQIDATNTYNSYSLKFKVNNNELDSVGVSSTSLINFKDISGCRADSGDFISAGEGEAVLSKCHFCSSVSVLTTEDCAENQYCDVDDGKCQPNICTLTGPTVIDVHGDVTSVKDRCTYSLMSDKESYEDFEVLASYKDRRRTDVSFLDSVTLKDTDITVLLEQGGRVKVGGEVVELTSSVKIIENVELSKTEAGVTAKLFLSWGKYFTLFFDGNTAQLHPTGINNYIPGGLCGGEDKATSSNQTESGSCQNMPPETSDLTDNCDEMKRRCNILMDDPFITCHAAVTPDPYITACKDTMCNYPDEDRLMCQYLEAYARACSLMNIQLGDWMSNEQCSTPQISCEDSPCSDHEFCGLVIGSPTCLCRAIFASSYRESGALGDPTVCTGDSASVSLVNCLLEEKGFSYSTLHLNDDMCKGEMDEDSHMVTFNFDNDNCGTELEVANGQVVYKNTIKTPTSLSSDVVTHHSQLKMDVSCVHTRPGIGTVGFRIRDSYISQVVRSEAFSYTVMMKAYTDAQRTKAVDSTTDVMLDQRIWVELTSDGLDENLVAMVTDSCWATGQQMSNSVPRNNLIQDGCANNDDSTVQVEGNGEGTSNYFSFRMFEFTDSSSGLYLHCKLHLCLQGSNTCMPVSLAAGF
ncbi:alpha-tectorin-like [Cololabis saira]|uniref:alpha-tectorin-like n=1 Tax=Cololabis saira TaxID=129043 RepID=UPI002AD35B2B|nr:alpha-tectorin-like [Cololabis saira]